MSDQLARCLHSGSLAVHNLKFLYILWHTQAKDKVTVSVEDAERLKVTMADFDHAIQFDVKPAFGISDEQLENYVFKGGQLWSIVSCDSHVIK